MAISDNYISLLYRKYNKQNNKSPLYNVNLGPGSLPAFPANTYPINRGTEPVNYLLYALSNVINPGNKTQIVTPLQALADSIPQVPFREKTGYEWGRPSYTFADSSDSYGTITDEDKSVTIEPTGISGSGSTSGEPVKAIKTEKPAKTPKKQQGLQKLTSDISATSSEQPRSTNITDAPIPTSAVAPQPVEPAPIAEPPIDESYYRYLRNNGFNDFLARQQAIRYY